VVLAGTVAGDPVTRRSLEIDQATGRPISDRAGTGCSVPSTSSDAREAVAPDVPAQRGAVPRSGLDLVRRTALVLAGAGLVRGFMERGPRLERAEHQDASERDHGLVSHKGHSSDGVTVVGGGGVTLASLSPTESPPDPNARRIRIRRALLAGWEQHRLLEGEGLEYERPVDDGRRWREQDAADGHVGSV
jgi:hypothetical protein